MPQSGQSGASSNGSSAPCLNLLTFVTEKDGMRTQKSVRLLYPSNFGFNNSSNNNTRGNMGQWSEKYDSWMQVFTFQRVSDFDSSTEHLFIWTSWEKTVETGTWLAWPFQGGEWGGCKGGWPLSGSPCTALPGKTGSGMTAGQDFSRLLPDQGQGMQEYKALIVYA